MDPLDTYTPESGSAGYTVKHYDLHLDYHTGPNRLVGRAVLDVRICEDSPDLKLDLVGLSVLKVALNGKNTRFRQTPNSVIIRGGFKQGQRLRLTVRYAGNPKPAMGTWGDVGWEELMEGVLVAGQPNGAQTWFPCNDHPRSKSTYTITVLSDSDYAVISNGSLKSTRRKASRTEWVWESRDPLTTYLATVQIGPYNSFELPALQHAPARIPLRVYTSPQQWPQASRALAKQHTMLNVFEDLFGPYPFDSYAVVVTNERLEIPLESQPLSILGSNHIAETWEAERLIAHELAHQWFGNSVSLRTWKDIWLNEGFACYAEWLWSEASGRHSVNFHAKKHWMAQKLLPKLLLTDPGAPDLFDDRVYKRGALTLHALRQMCGDARFFQLMQTWCAQHRHSHATTADFLDLVTNTFGTDIAQRLHPWLFEPNLPSLPDGLMG